MNHKENDFVGATDRESVGLAQLLNFFKVASKGDDVRRWCPWYHEIFLGLGLLSREYLAPCCL